VRICAAPDRLHAARIATGEANALLGCDLVTTASCESLALARAGLTRAAVNTAPTVTGELLLHPEHRFPGDALRRTVERALAPGAATFVDAQRLATAFTGDTITANMLLLGYAWQLGLVPLSEAAILRAIELNGVAVALNQRAFRWGRRAAADPLGVARLAGHEAPALGLDGLVEDRAQRLVAYQDKRLAERYRRLVERVRAVEAERVGTTALAETVARGYFRLLAHKDEYEVARVFASPAFRARLDAAFEGEYRVRWHVAPAWLGARDARSGETPKRALGNWAAPAFAALARLRALRGSRLDPFARQTEHRATRAEREEYEATIGMVLDRLDASNHAIAIELAALPEHVRGYGPVRARSLDRARKRQAELLHSLSGGAAESDPA
jgi:indolepyruvate ferredoxin oxidoreductase